MIGRRAPVSDCGGRWIGLTSLALSATAAVAALVLAHPTHRGSGAVSVGVAAAPRGLPGAPQAPATVPPEGEAARGPAGTAASRRPTRPAPEATAGTVTVDPSAAGPTPLPAVTMETGQTARRPPHAAAREAREGAAAREARDGAAAREARDGAAAQGPRPQKPASRAGTRGSGHAADLRLPIAARTGTGAAPAPAPDRETPARGGPGFAGAIPGRAPFLVPRVAHDGDRWLAHLTPAGGQPARDGTWHAVGGAPAPGWRVIGISAGRVSLMTPALNVVVLAVGAAPGLRNELR